MIQLLQNNTRRSGIRSEAEFERAVATDSLSARFIDEIAELEAIVPGWKELEKSARFRNPFFEHNFLIPAFRHLREPGARVLVVESHTETGSSGTSVLFGVLPVKESRLFNLPMRHLEAWKHDHCNDSTPLLHGFCADKVFEQMLSFLSNQKYSLLSFDTVTADPGFNDLAQRTTAQAGLASFQRSCFSRAALEPTGDVEDYLASHVSKSVQRNSRRFARRLAEQGDVTFLQSDETSDFGQLAEEFLQIEASGWKGETGTALSCNTHQANFYRDMIRRTADVGKAKFVSMRLDGRAIAMLSDIESHGLLAAYKTAFDDQFAAFSPGTLLELKNIEFMHESDLEIADSCTDPENNLLNRIWGQRLPFQNLVIGLRRGLPNLAVRSMPVAKRIRDQIKRRTKKSSS